jgi:geranylgeranyl reductase
MLRFPDEIIEHKVTEVGLYSGKYENHKTLPEPVVFTVNRNVFADWQFKRLNGTQVEVRTSAKVTSINSNSVVVNDSEEIEFDFLVGSDGPNSAVRKHLKLPVEKVLATIQYIVPVKGQSGKLEIFMEPKYFKSWYAWSFPHKDSVALGACCDPKYMSGKELKANFGQWLKKRGIDISKAKYESYPISYDYRGLKFGNIFLTGEAAGLASGLTGEGIYQSLVSGEEVANLILDNSYASDDFKFILKYNRIQESFMRFMLKIGPGRRLVANLLILFMRNPMVNKKISKGFS